ncbi:hypothetical protein EV200_101245 [Pedobacter psychrotolerans]|uniref:Uncharacterized protein n=1 Tax=Pedobacter psychrotolerans TaxID=1843235 RepID=A0A4V2S0A0_9SPHI|nr:hypothetical protein EV200_101245 [Pedobacter psychrotolerans]
MLKVVLKTKERRTRDEQVIGHHYVETILSINVLCTIIMIF